DWQFGYMLTTEQVWDAFVLQALLDDHQSRNMCLVVPHDGDQQDRFVLAMQDRNQRIVIDGQEELSHACYGCMRVFEMDDGTSHYTEVVV
ncbi:hypothetical protein EV363DRAFT_1144981, partial [Boletus edulis]